MSTSITPFIFQVPTAHRLVLRNVWKSSSENQGRPRGYTVLHEGYALWLPWFWHQVVALKDTRPKTSDPSGVKVQTLDGQTVTVNVRFTSRTMQGFGPDETGDDCFPVDQQPQVDGKPVTIDPTWANNILLNAIREGEGGINREQLISQVLEAALNSATSDYTAISYSVRDLEIIAETAFGKPGQAQQPAPPPDDKARIQALPRQLWGWGVWTLQNGDLKLDSSGKLKTKKGLAEFNRKDLDNLSREIQGIVNAELVQYGLRLDKLTIQGISTSGPLEAALIRRAAATIETHTAAQERSAMAELLALLPEGQQSVWATTILIALNQFADRVTDLVSAFARGKSSGSGGDKTQPKPAAEAKAGSPKGKNGGRS